MQANNRDAGSLWDMVSAIYRIQEFTTNLTYNAYLDSGLIQSAVERQLEILGKPRVDCRTNFDKPIQRLTGVESLDYVIS